MKQLEKDRYIDGELVSLPTEKDYYILMVRYGGDYWSAMQTFNSLEELQSRFSTGDLSATDGVWKIVKATLPVEVPDGG